MGQSGQTAIADTWDTQLVNLLEYLQRNEDSSERLAVLDEESEKYARITQLRHGPEWLFAVDCHTEYWCWYTCSETSQLAATNSYKFALAKTEWFLGLQVNKADFIL